MLSYKLPRKARPDHVPHWQLSLDNFVTAIKRLKNTPEAKELTSHRSEIYDETRPIASWTGSKDIDHAWQMYSTIWPYGHKLAAGIRARLAPELHKLHGQLALAVQERPAMVPGRLDMQAAILDNRPEHFVRDTYDNDTAAGDTECASIYINIGYAFNIDIPRLLKFSITLCEIINSLEQLNLVKFRIVLVYVVNQNYHESPILIEIVLKDYLNDVNYNMLMNSIAAPFFMRRFVFLLMESQRELDRITCYGGGHYGYVESETSKISALLKRSKQAEINILWNLANYIDSVLTVLEPLKKSLPELYKIIQKVNL